MLSKIRRRIKKEEGFTLIELVVVVIILGVLAAALIPAVLGRVDEAKISRAKSDMEAIATAARLYYVDNGEWPDDLGDLEEDYGITETGDPWGGNYSISVDSNGDLNILCSKSGITKSVPKP